MQFNLSGKPPYTATVTIKDSANKTVLTGKYAVTADGFTVPESTTSASGTVSIPTAPSSNPFAGQKLLVFPEQHELDAVKKLRDQGRISDADLIQTKILNQPKCWWLGDWNGDVEASVKEFEGYAIKQAAMNVYVIYNIPLRDVGQYSAGGKNDPVQYRAWIDAISRGLGSRKAVFIVEPDTLPQISNIDSAKQADRYQMIQYVVSKLPNCYIDIGHPRWLSVDDAVDRLKKAGIDKASGFSINVSNFCTDTECMDYGKKISERLGGKPFIFDCGRNGNGPAPDGQWCNPPGRALGLPPLINDDPKIPAHAALWVKGPLGSDGSRDGAPPAGSPHPEYALQLAPAAKW